MIHINMNGKTPPEDWLQRAHAVTEQLNQASTIEERYTIIDKNQKLWGELKQWLLDQSYNKCWYTEARNDSSYFEVEHFRPKKWENSKEDDFEGYWWLAFEWTNYRACGSAPNRKKGAFFPLHPDSQRASGDKQHLVDDEIYCLLDPVEPNDPLLLSFNENGAAIPMPGTAGWDEARAKVSIDLYGLNNLPQLCEGRRRIWQECRSLLDDLVELHTKSEKTPTANVRARIKEKTIQLRLKTKSDQPFSAIAQECLHASGHPWAPRIAGS